MIDYTSYKKVYTNGEMFTLTGENFYGFVETEGEVAKEVSTGKVLSAKNTYATDLFFTPTFTDRVVSDTNITLPNTLNDCTFNVNDNFNYDLFKYKLNAIRENNTYVYSRLFISSNKLPYTDSLRYAYVAEADDQAFSIGVSDADNPQFKTNTRFKDTNYLSAFGSIVGATTQASTVYSDRFSLFACTSSSLLCLTGSNNSLTIVEDSTGYETEDNNLSFKEIGGVTSTQDFLYLSDTGNNVVLRYDIAGYVNDDSSLRNRRNYIELVGGSGDSSRQTKFNRPTKVTASDNTVAVFDSGNRVIKLFTPEFNYITRITSIDFQVETLGAFGFDPDFDALYVVTSKDVVNNDTTTRVATLYRYSGDNYKFKEQTILNDRLDSDEAIVDISFSKTDSNYWYFATNKTVYKKFKTRPSDVIGKYKTERLYLLSFAGPDDGVVINNRWNFADITYLQSSYKWNIGTGQSGTSTIAIDGLLDSQINSFSIFQSTSSHDRTIMLTNGRLYFFDEPTVESYQRVIKDSNYSNYGTNALSLNSDGFIQQSLINIEIYKLINDVLVIKNNIVGRFSGKYNNNILELDDYNYNLDFDKLITEEIENFYVHGNEENLTGVLNRCFDLIYQVQSRLINFVQPDVDSVLQPSYTTKGIIEI